MPRLDRCYKWRMPAKPRGPAKPARPGSRGPKVSAGLLMYRFLSGELEFLFVHLGGPFWARKGDGAWFLPKGEVLPGENHLGAARREFEEETSLRAPAEPGRFAALGAVRQKSGKTIHAWAFEGDCDPGALRSNTFAIEWPPRSGREREFPEVDRFGWFALDEARRKIHPAELPFIERLAGQLENSGEIPNARRAPSKP